MVQATVQRSVQVQHTRTSYGRTFVNVPPSTVSTIPAAPAVRTADTAVQYSTGRVSVLAIQRTTRIIVRSSLCGQASGQVYEVKRPVKRRGGDGGWGLRLYCQSTEYRVQSEYREESSESREQRAKHRVHAREDQVNALASALYFYSIYSTTTVWRDGLFRAMRVCRHVCRCHARGSVHNRHLASWPHGQFWSLLLSRIHVTRRFPSLCAVWKLKTWH